MSLAIKMQCEPLRTLTFTAIGATYVGIGTALNFPARIIHVQNFTDIILLFSFDGITDHFVLAPSSFILLDFSSNKTLETGYFMGKGTRLYCEQLTVAPTTGFVSFTTFYGIDF